MNTDVLEKPQARTRSNVEGISNSNANQAGAPQVQIYTPAVQTDAYSEFLIAQAERLGTRLCRDAIWHKQQCNWIGPSMEFINTRWQPIHRSLGPDLYSGTAGIALFLAELYKQRELGPVRKTAEAALNNAVANRHKMLPSVSAGYYCGLLGLADVVHRFAEQFHSNEWHRQFEQLISELTAQGPDEQGIDVIMGSAGAIPALVELYKRTQIQSLLDLAEQHANQLLSIAVTSPQGYSWDTLNTGDQHPHLTGYAHGTSGVSLALAELYAVTGYDNYGDAARAGFNYENSHFDAAQQNWPDFRNLESMGISTDTKVCAVAWCHGSAGIGLARLRAYELLKDDRLQQDAQAAVNTTQKQLAQYVQAPGFDFTYCHGAIGDAELLLLADQYSGSNQHRDFVCQLMAWAINTYETPGIEWPSGVPDAGESPSLFLGTAGIGHFMLRAANPAQVSSVLLSGTT